MLRLIIPIILVLFISCGSTNGPTLDYSKLSYDTSRITIFQWDTTKRKFLPNSDPLPLAQQDLFVVDSLLRIAIDSCNAGISARFPGAYLYTIHQEKYKYQYFPYENVNGKRIISIYGSIPHYSRPHLELEINLSDKTCGDGISGVFNCVY